MEPVTHFLSGAILSRVGFNRKTAYATLAMTLAAETPDIDVLWYLRGPVAGFQHHRGITHTFLGAPFEALLVTVVLWTFHRFRSRRARTDQLLPPRWALIWLFSLLAVFLHILLDFTNNYGVRPLFPFSPDWHAWSIVFIVDPFLLFVFSLALIIPALFALTDHEMTNTRNPIRGRGWAIAALVIVALYYGLRNAEHAHATELARTQRVGSSTPDEGGLQTPLRIAAEPYPFNPFHWHAIVETRDYYQTAEVHTLEDLVTTSDQNDRIAKPPLTPAVAAAKRSWLGQVYLSWAALPLTRDTGPLPDSAAANQLAHTEVDFEDLRFAYSATPGSNEGHSPLSASVLVAPDGAIAGMFMGSSEQRAASGR